MKVTTLEISQRAAFALLLTFGSLVVVAPAAVAAPGDVVRMGVDANGDGILSLMSADPRVPVDQTTPQTPFVFWENDDQDDLEEYETWPVERPDASTLAIDSLRDLEDVFRLLVVLPEGSRSGDVQLRFSFQNTKQDTDAEPALNLFRSADAACSRRFLADVAAGQAQLTEPYSASLGAVSAAQPLTISVTGSETVCLLAESAAVGTGKLFVGVDGDQQSVSAPVHLELRDVKSMYLRTTMDWPEEIGPPWTYIDQQPPVPDLRWEVDTQGHGFKAPWYETDDVIVWVYGWQKEGDEGYFNATVRGGETIFKRLWHRGFRGRIVFFHWPTVKPMLAYGLLESEYRAYKCAPQLVSYLSMLSSDKNVHVISHSLGNVMLLESLRLGFRARNAVFQLAAIPAGAVDVRDELVLEDMRDVQTPDFAADSGYRGYLQESSVRVHSVYNAGDRTWPGYNLAQKLLKPTGRGSTQYQYRPNRRPDKQFRVRKRVGLFFSRTRPVTDPHEILAFIAQSKTQALGAEARVQGVISGVSDVGRDPYDFGAGHTVAWAWGPHRTTEYYNLVLDLFNIPFRSERL